MTADAQEDRVPQPAETGSAEMARLRDRTDELELIISGLTTVALFTLPGWLFERLAESFTHLSVSMVVGGTMMLVVLTGLCYGLACCFLIHLMARAYWVGLIGLRTVFPQGIDWQRTPGIGPLTRERYRQRLPDLKTAIERSDRLASSLFAVISVIALGITWVGGLLALTVILGGFIGARFGATNAGTFYAFLVLIAMAVGVPALLWLLDAQLGARWPRLQKAGWFRSLLNGLARINGLVYPQRLILPVQLTLQSNTRPILFLVGLTVSVLAIMLIGQFSLNRAANFTVSDQFKYLDEQHLEGAAFRSSFYEDLRDGRDRLRGWPTIPAFEQRGGHVRLFLPYQPLRDNLLLDQLCPGEDAALGAACLARLWSVSLNGERVDATDFLAGERLDLGMRGLIGAIPLIDVRPGIQLLHVTWNPAAAADDIPMDDRYSRARFDYQIPFLFVPDFERELDDEPDDPPANHAADE